MASLRIDLRTDIAVNQMNHFEVSLIHPSDLEKNRFTVIPVKSEGDYVRAERIATINSIFRNTIYLVAIRIFLNNGNVRSRLLSVAIPDRTCRWFFFIRRCTEPTAQLNVVITA